MNSTGDHLGSLTNRNFFAAAYLWNDESQLERFIREGKWENGNEKKVTKAVNSAKIGDVLLAKTTWIKGQSKGSSNGILTIRAVGVVINNHQDGHTLEVNWHPFKEPIELEIGSHYRFAFQAIRDKYLEGILNELTNKSPDLINIIESLSYPKKENPTPEQKEEKESTRDKIPFQYDRVVAEDELGREPAAMAFCDLIKEDIFTRNLDHAFMVHLQGEWGAGKSTFLNLIKKHLSDEKRKWIVIDYNAWKNQHLNPPWWTFIDQVYQKTKTDPNFRDKGLLRRKERSRRIKYYTAWQKLFAFILTLAFIGLILLFGNEIFATLTGLFSSNETGEPSKGLTMSSFLKLTASLGSFAALLYSLSKFLTTPLFKTSSKEAISFMERTADPLEQIRSHFKKLVADINKNHQLAIFIDDIDRCDRTFIVDLLEGIQTLFKEEKVLYIVAGDKQWISKAFQKQYEEFDTERKTDQNLLGDLFIRKAFQLSIRMPQVSNTRKKNYWDHILGVKDGENQSRQIEDMSSSEKNEFENEIARISDDQIANPEVLEEIERKFKVSPDEVSKRAIRRKNATSAELKHLLRDFHHLLDANPRSIIRLANFYTMTRSTLIAERRDTRPNMLFRWLILKEVYPLSIQQIMEVNDISDFKKLVQESELAVNNKQKIERLLQGEGHQEALTIEIIKELEGL